MRAVIFDQPGRKPETLWAAVTGTASRNLSPRGQSGRSQSADIGQIKFRSNTQRDCL